MSLTRILAAIEAEEARQLAEIRAAADREVANIAESAVADTTVAETAAYDHGLRELPHEQARRLQAAKLATVRLVGEAREAAGKTATRVYMALHTGDVLYGNIGSTDRLDFTVVGPAVNEAARIEVMCRSVERDLVISSAFRDSARPESQERLVSLGRYALRGVSRPQELFTLHG